MARGNARLVSAKATEKAGLCGGHLVNLIGIYGADVCLEGIGKPFKGVGSDTGDRLLSFSFPILL